MNLFNQPLYILKQLHLKYKDAILEADKEFLNKLVIEIERRTKVYKGDL